MRPAATRWRFSAARRSGPMRRARYRVASLLGAVLAATTPARALVVQDEGDAAARAPLAPGTVDHVGQISGTTGVYLGDGWVLTARHVGAGELRLESGRHPAVPGSWVAIDGDSPDANPPDLGLFRVDPPPALPRLEIARRAPRPGDPLLLVGCGLGRGAAFEWEDRIGWRWTGPSVCRWGRNQIASVDLDAPTPGTSTRVFATFFSEREPQEAQAAHGDSGGAAFAARRGTWVLAGILIAVKTFPNQPAGTSMTGNSTHVADLHHYRSAILAVIGREAGGR